MKSKTKLAVPAILNSGSNTYLSLNTAFSSVSAEEGGVGQETRVARIENAIDGDWGKKWLDDLAKRVPRHPGVAWTVSWEVFRGLLFRGG